MREELLGAREILDCVNCESSLMPGREFVPGRSFCHESLVLLRIVRQETDEEFQAVHGKRQKGVEYYGFA